MTSYVLVLFYVSMLLLLSRRNSSGIFYYIASIVMIMFAGFRSHVGMDYDSYLQAFNDIKIDAMPFAFEPLNMILTETVFFFGGTTQLIFLIYSTLTISSIFYFVKKISLSKELSIFIFLTIGIYYLSTFNGIRQWMAISMILVAIAKLIDKKYYQMIVFFIVAALFHISAVIFIILPLLVIRWSKKIVFITFVSSTLVASAALFIIQNSQYAIYMNGLNFSNTGSPLFFILYVFLMIFFLIFFGYFNKKTVLTRAETLLLNMSIASIYTLLIGYILNIDFLSIMRINMYFQMQLIILVPWFLVKIKNQKIRGLLLASILMFCTSYFFATLYFNGEKYQLVPYLFNINLY